MYAMFNLLSFSNTTILRPMELEVNPAVLGEPDHAAEILREHQRTERPQLPNSTRVAPLTLNPVNVLLF
jgi:hypothetical protein